MGASANLKYHYSSRCFLFHDVGSGVPLVRIGSSVKGDWCLTYVGDNVRWGVWLGQHLLKDNTGVLR